MDGTGGSQTIITIHTTQIEYTLPQAQDRPDEIEQIQEQLLTPVDTMPLVNVPATMQAGWTSNAVGAKRAGEVMPNPPYP